MNSKKRQAIRDKNECTCTYEKKTINMIYIKYKKQLPDKTGNCFKLNKRYNLNPVNNT